MVTPIGGPRPGDEVHKGNLSQIPQPPKLPNSPTEGESQTYIHDAKNYLWNQLLPWLVANQRDIPNYAQLATRVEQLRANPHLSPSQLEHDIHQIYSEAGGHGVGPIPVKKNTTELAKEALEEMESELTGLDRGIHRLKEKVRALEKRLHEDQTAQVHNPQVVKDIDKCRKMLNSIKNKLEELKDDRNIIRQEKNAAEKCYHRMKNASPRDQRNLLNQIKNYENQAHTTDNDATAIIKKVHKQLNQLSKEVHDIGRGQEANSLNTPSPYTDDGKDGVSF